MLCSPSFLICTVSDNCTLLEYVYVKTLPTTFVDSTRYTKCWLPFTSCLHIFLHKREPIILNPFLYFLLSSSPQSSCDPSVHPTIQYVLYDPIRPPLQVRRICYLNTRQNPSHWLGLFIVESIYCYCIFSARS